MNKTKNQKVINLMCIRVSECDGRQYGIIVGTRRTVKKLENRSVSGRWRQMRRMHSVAFKIPRSRWPAIPTLSRSITFYNRFADYRLSLNGLKAIGNLCSFQVPRPLSNYSMTTTQGQLGGRTHYHINHFSVCAFGSARKKKEENNNK